MKRWIALVGISLLAFTAFLDVTIVNTALPFIQSDFGATILELQWITNIFILLLAMTMVAAGRFADIHGRKLVFYSGVAIFALGAIGAGLSPSIGYLILFRAVQGLGGSILFVSSVSLISEAFEKDEHGRATGIYTGITGLGLAIGPVLGGFLVGWLGWRWVFWVNLPLIVIGYTCCALCLKLNPHTKPNLKIDKKGLTLLIAGLGTLIYGIIEAANRTPFFWAYLLLGLFLLTYFFLSERKSKMPLLDISIFKNPLILLCILSVSAGFGTVVYMFFDPLYLRTLRHLSAYEIGLMITAIPIGQVAVSFIFNRLLKLVGVAKYQLISIGLAFLSTLTHRFIGPSTPLLCLLVPFFLLGLNWGTINTGVIAGVTHAANPSKVGEAIGSVFTFWNITGSIFLAVSSAIFHLIERHSFITAFHTMTTVNLLFSFLFLLAGVRVLKYCR
ncbi:MAG: MFS transporter [Verrucomicrobia bacterium]|nr:MFS transporter [Verrucomicrobiota bacterium]